MKFDLSLKLQIKSMQILLHIRGSMRLWSAFRGGKIFIHLINYTPKNGKMMVSNVLL